MDVQLKDGRGTGEALKITKAGRALTEANVTFLKEQSSIEAVAFNINSGAISLTANSASGVLYVKNNGTDSLLIHSIGILFGRQAAAATNDTLIRVIFNPTTGTLISGALTPDIPFRNKYVGSSNIPSLTVYKGVQGATITDGTVGYLSVRPQPVDYVIDTGVVVLPQGQSIAVEVTPSAGSVTLNCQCFLAVSTYPLPSTQGK